MNWHALIVEHKFCKLDLEFLLTDLKSYIFHTYIFAFFYLLSFTVPTPYSKIYFLASPWSVLTGLNPKH